MITQKIIARTDSLKLDKIISRYGEDSMRQVVFIIVRPDPDSEELIPITIPEDAVGSFRILKPSGNFVIVPMSKSALASGETAFDVVLPASANTAKGSGYYDIRITSETDKYYFTAQGDFLIDDNIISDEVLEDVSEVNGLVFPDDFITVDDHVAIIDDDTLSTDSTWSSDKISEEIESHAGGDVSKTVSGNPITFDDGASAPLVKCVTAITGSQDLHGYDKPWVGGAGKNKLQNNATSQTINTVVFTVNTDGTIVANGTASANTVLYLKTGLNGEDYNGMVLSGCTGGSANTYYLAFGENSSPYREFKDTGDGVDISGLESKTGWRFYIYIASGTVMNNVKFYPMARTSGTSATYEPYSNICPITAYTEGEVVERGRNGFQNLDPSTVYTARCTFSLSDNTYTMVCSGNDAQIGNYPANGSTYVESSGTKQKCTVGESIKIVPSNTAINKNYIAFYNDEDVVIFRTRCDLNAVTVPDGAKYYTVRLGRESSGTNTYTFTVMVLKSTDTDTTFTPYVGTTHTTTYPSSIYRGSEDVVNGEVTSEWGMIASYAGETLPGEWISDRDEYAPGTTPTTGAQVAYALATPTTSSVTPTNLPIKSLSGYNHIESSTGDMEVEYIIQRYQPLIDSIKQL